MKALITLETLSPQPVTDRILALNKISGEYGLTLTEEEARELSETRKTALIENERIEVGEGAVPEIVRKFCASRYVDRENYTYVLNEITWLFYYIKTETDDKIGDAALIDELFERFELYCRGSVDLLESREAERIIRKINAGKHYVEWYAERDELNPDGGDGTGRETPGGMLEDSFGRDHFEEDEADHDRWEAEEDLNAIYDAESDPDAYDDFEAAPETDEDLSLYDVVGDEVTGEDGDPAPGRLDVSIGGVDAQLSVGSSDYMGLFDGEDDGASAEDGGDGEDEFTEDDGSVGEYFDLDAFDAYFDREAKNEKGESGDE